MPFEERYARQMKLRQVGAAGQQKLARCRLALVGCGALGTHQADLLARIGVGGLRLIDRDVVELSNLPRQTLYDESDVARRLPKARAAAEKLQRINSALQLEVRVADFNAATAEALLQGVDGVLDASDNFETRYLLNDVCVRQGLPWSYGGVLGTAGMALFVAPGRGPCLRCLFPEAPAPGRLPSCEEEGVLVTAPATVAARQVSDMVRWLLEGEVEPQLHHVDLWRGEYRSLRVAADPQCRCCAQKQFDFLQATSRPRAVSLCGRQAVQLLPPQPEQLDLQQLENRLRGEGPVHNNGWLLVFQAEGLEAWIFPDGRVMVRGTDDPARAQALYDRYLSGWRRRP